MAAGSFFNNIKNTMNNLKRECPTTLEDWQNLGWD